MLSAIIVAGGSSQRMGFDKLFALLAGEPVIAHALAAFEETSSVGEIIVVGRSERLTELQLLVSRQGFRKVNAIVPGGQRRQDSVECGLKRTAPGAEFVAVHDAARPLIRPWLIAKIYEAARNHGGAASGTAVIDTLKRVNQDREVVGGVDRAHLFAVETPQIFRRELLQKAYRHLADAGLEVTDEISAVEEVGGQVVIVPNDEKNFKITVPSDLTLAELILRSRI